MRLQAAIELQTLHATFLREYGYKISINFNAIGTVVSKPRSRRFVIGLPCEIKFNISAGCAAKQKEISLRNTRVTTPRERRFNLCHPCSNFYLGHMPYARTKEIYTA